MTITLEQLVSRWKGRRATFEVVLPDDVSQSRAYQGILDGPYHGDDGGVGFMLGSRVIDGDIAVEGPLIDFLPAGADDKTAPVLGESYVELRVVVLPLVADVQGDEAGWTAMLADERTALCRLIVTDSDEDAHAREAVIYVELLDEAVSVWRPVTAISEGEGVYRLPLDIPDDEAWAFRPGSRVRVERRLLEDGTHLVACGLAD